MPRRGPSGLRRVISIAMAQCTFPKLQEIRMLHTELNDALASHAGLHPTITFALVQCALTYDPLMTLTEDGLPQLQFTLRTGLPEPTFQALVDTGCIEHKQQGVLGAQHPDLFFPFFFYYQSVRIGAIDWLIIYDLGQSLVIPALQQWRMQNGIHAMFEQSSGTYEEFLMNPCIGGQCFLDEAQSDEPTMLRLEALMWLFLTNAPEVRALMDTPATQLMVVSAGMDYEQYLRPDNPKTQKGNRAARRSKKKR